MYAVYLAVPSLERTLDLPDDAFHMQTLPRAQTLGSTVLLYTHRSFSHDSATKRLTARQEGTCTESYQGFVFLAYACNGYPRAYSGQFSYPRADWRKHITHMFPAG